MSADRELPNDPPPKVGDRVEMRDPWGPGWLLATVEKVQMVGGFPMVTAEADKGQRMVTWWNGGIRAIATVAVVALFAGCGTLTATQRERLALETQRCVLNERAIVDRESTAEEDARDLAVERARCDAARAAAVEGP